MTSAPPHRFSGPHNWCDRLCERCPLADECRVHLRDRQRRWVHEARHEDPDDWEVVMTDVAADIGKTIEMLGEIAEREGIDLDAPLPKRPIPLAGARLARAAKALPKSLEAAIGASACEPSGATEGVRDEAALREARSIAMTITMKVAGLSATLGVCDETDPADEASWIEGTVPNLLLVELLRVRFDRAVAELRAARSGAEAWLRVETACAELDRTLAPFLRGVRPEERALLASLVARGEAPSPFCVVDSAESARGPGERGSAPGRAT